MLPDGTPKELFPSQPSAYEFHPSFNRDGSKIVHVLWDDLALSTIQVVDVDVQSGVVSQVNPPLVPGISD